MLTLRQRRRELPAVTVLHLDLAVGRHLSVRDIVTVAAVILSVITAISGAGIKALLLLRRHSRTGALLKVLVSALATRSLRAHHLAVRAVKILTVLVLPVRPLIRIKTLSVRRHLILRLSILRAAYLSGHCATAKLLFKLLKSLPLRRVKLTLSLRRLALIAGFTGGRVHLPLIVLRSALSLTGRAKILAVRPALRRAAEIVAVIRAV